VLQIQEIATEARKFPYFSTGLSDPSGAFPPSRSVKQQRPDCTAGKTGYLSNPTSADYYDVTAFSVPGSNIGRFGNCGVGILEGPGTVTFSMFAGKTFSRAIWLTVRGAVRQSVQYFQ
jgi:hypothetical protein